jgi:aspartate/methionine/tyrosine aminotransferase
MFQAKTNIPNTSNNSIDPIQLLNMRAQEVERTRGIKVQYAGIGKPNAYVGGDDLGLAGLAYWHEILAETTIQGQLLRMKSNKKPEDSVLTEAIDSIVTKLDEPQTLGSPRTLAAKGFNQFYNLYEALIKPRHILFPIGGGGGLRAVFEVSQGSIVVKRPFYTLYVGPNSTNKLLTYDEILEAKTRGNVDFGSVIDKAVQQKQKISLILFCNPDNPTGKVISREEWEYIIKKLKPLIEQDEECYVGVDEAYIELKFSNNKPSLLEFIAEKLVQIKIGQGAGLETEVFYRKLLKSLVIFRSGTKALSASGLRMSAMIVFDEKLGQKLEHKIQELGSLPAHLKLAYATAVSHFNTRIQGGQLFFLNDFYQVQVRHAEQRAKELDIAAKNVDGQFEPVDGTFYICINLQCLIGLQVTEPDIQAQLAKWELNSKTLKTDLDIAYYLLLKKGVMLAPLSIFGGAPAAGILRVTCSEGIAFLDKIFNKLKNVIDKMPTQSKLMRQSDRLAASFAESPAGSPLLSPAVPSSPILGRESLRFEQAVLPPQIFADYMCQFWKKIASGAEQAEILRNQSFKASVKPYFIEALVGVLHDLRRTEIRLDLGSIAAKLYMENQKELEEIILKFNWNFKGEDEIFYGILCEQSFDVIFKDVQENGERSLFYDACFEIYAQTPKTELIQQIVDLKSVIDYTHPQGKKNYTEIMSRTLNMWYGREISSSKNLLFFSVEPTAFINNIFRHTPADPRVIIWEGFETEAEIDKVLEKEKPVAIAFCVFGEKIGAALDIEQLNKTARLLGKILAERKNFYLVVNESDVERCCQTHTDFGKHSMISRLLEQDGSVEFKERLLIIRSSVGIFTTEKERISILVASETIMDKAISESVNAHGHAPSDLQFAYSCALAYWTNALFRPEYQKSSALYVSALCRYYEQEISPTNGGQENFVYAKMSVERPKELLWNSPGSATRTDSAPPTLNSGNGTNSSVLVYARVCKFLQ